MGGASPTRDRPTREVRRGGSTPSLVSGLASGLVRPASAMVLQAHQAPVDLDEEGKGS